MLAYVISSCEADPQHERMDLNMAFCNSTIRNARKEALPQVEDRLKEIIDRATGDLDSFPNPKGIEGLRANLLDDGMEQIKYEID